MAASGFLKAHSCNGRYTLQNRYEALRPKFVESDVQRLQDILIKSLVWMAASLSPCQGLVALDCPCKKPAASATEACGQTRQNGPPCTASCCGHSKCGPRASTAADAGARASEKRSELATQPRSPICGCPAGCKCEQHHSPERSAPPPESERVVDAQLQLIAVSGSGQIALTLAKGACSAAIPESTAPTLGLSIVLCRLTV